MTESRIYTHYKSLYCSTHEVFYVDISRCLVTTPIIVPLAVVIYRRHGLHRKDRYQKFFHFCITCSLSRKLAYRAVST
jgi:hypothetical protein